MVFWMLFMDRGSWRPLLVVHCASICKRIPGKSDKRLMGCDVRMGIVATSSVWPPAPRRKTIKSGGCTIRLFILNKLSIYSRHCACVLLKITKICRICRIYQFWNIYIKPEALYTESAYMMLFRWERSKERNSVVFMWTKGGSPVWRSSFCVAFQRQQSDHQGR